MFINPFSIVYELIHVCVSYLNLVLNILLFLQRFLFNWCINLILIIKLIHIYLLPIWGHISRIHRRFSKETLYESFYYREGPPRNIKTKFWSTLELLWWDDDLQCISMGQNFANIVKNISFKYPPKGILLIEFEFFT